MPTRRIARKPRTNGAPGSINAAAGDMRYLRFPTFLCLSALAGILLAWHWSRSPVTPGSQAILGTVRDNKGPVPGAAVRIQQGSESTLTDRQGLFRLLTKVQTG